MSRPSITIPFLLLVAGIIGIFVFLAWSLGLGWVLTKLFGFTLFEGSLLAMISSISVWYALARLLAAAPPELDFDEDGIPLKAVGMEIPKTRFYKTDKEKTLEAWFCYSLANNIYLDMQANPRMIASMDSPRLQELAIRLAEIIVQLLKRKPIRKKKVRITAADLREQMNLMDQKPYDEDILALAVRGANDLLQLTSAENVVRNRQWDQRTDMFDMIE
jgi:hypothetical protein